jgi:hypothetical protein
LWYADAGSGTSTRIIRRKTKKGKNRFMQPLPS